MTRVPAIDIETVSTQTTRKRRSTPGHFEWRVGSPVASAKAEGQQPAPTRSTTRRGEDGRRKQVTACKAAAAPHGAEGAWLCCHCFVSSIPNGLPASPRFVLHTHRLFCGITVSARSTARLHSHSEPTSWFLSAAIVCVAARLTQPP
jgi:hypothetical protein